VLSSDRKATPGPRLVQPFIRQEIDVQRIRSAVDGTKLKSTVKRNSERFIMNIVVIGGSGLIGSKV